MESTETLSAECQNARALPLASHARRLALLLGLALSLLGAAESLPEGSDFGAELTLGKVRSLAAVLAKPEAFAQTPVLVRARIADVCQKKGCWTILRDGERSVRVRFKDYGFFLPKDIQGREALVEGVVTVRTLSEREARHYAEESRDGNPKSIHGPQREVGFLATGVRVLAAD